MRILSITAGAAGMYCGSCFRDNALAAELLKRGQDVSLVPLYTPTRTDEANVSARRVLFGGISVYLQQLSPIFRKTPWLVDRLWDSPRIISAFANRASGSTDARVLGELTISMLNGESGVLKKEFEKLVDWIRQEPLPDVVNIPNTLLISLAAPLKRAVGRPVCCTLSGEELFLDGLPLEHRDRAIALIRQQVPDVDRFIAVSEYCARYMTELFAIPSGRISVVPLGIDMAGYTMAAPSRDRFTVGYLARIAPEKGLNLLAQAYIHFKGLIGGAPSRLRAAGYKASGPSPYLDLVRKTLADAGLDHEFEYVGEVDRAGKIAFLRELDVLSVPATYDEPKGLFLLEAMAAGVPVVQPRRGAFTEVVEKTGGGLLTGTDPKSLAEGLHSLWKDSTLRTSLGARAFAGVREHYTLAQSADRFLEVAAGLTRGVAQVA
jgi:glycosyltransferase involved in cell wall biosynthesis